MRRRDFSARANLPALASDVPQTFVRSAQGKLLSFIISSWHIVHRLTNLPSSQ